MQLCETVCRTAGPGIHPLLPGYEALGNDNVQCRADVYEENLFIVLPFSTRNSTLTAPSIKLILLGEYPTTILVQGIARSGVSEFSEHS